MYIYINSIFAMYIYINSIFAFFFLTLWYHTALSAAHTFCKINIHKYYWQTLSSIIITIMLVCPRCGTSNLHNRRSLSITLLDIALVEPASQHLAVMTDGILYPWPQHPTNKRDILMLRKSTSLYPPCTLSVQCHP